MFRPDIEEDECLKIDKSAYRVSDPKEHVCIYMYNIYMCLPAVADVIA